MKHFHWIVFILFPLCLISQNYDDVAVLINTNDAESILIGEYYQDKNNIPDDNILYVAMPNMETIDSLEAIPFLEEIQNQLNTNPLSDQINYIVTTKGCPQLVEPFYLNPEITTRSFDILVALLTTSAMFNDYLGETDPFTYLDYGYRIVSRLDAGTLEGTYRLIDKGGLQQIDINRKIVLDYYAPFTAGDEIIRQFLVDKLVETSDSLHLLGIATQLDTVSEYYGEDTSLLAYSQIAFGINGVPVSPFVERTHELAILQEVGTALKSSYGTRLTVYDFLEAKCHAAIGFCNIFYISSFDQINFFQNYFDLDKGMNLGESVFSSNNLNTPISLFGDPKSKVELISSISDPQPSLFEKIFPSPALNHINVHFKDQKDRRLFFYDNNGRELFSTSISHQENHVDISTINAGFFFIVIQEDGKTEARKLIKI